MPPRDTVALVGRRQQRHLPDDRHAAGFILGTGRLPVPREVIAMAVRTYLRYGLSYRDVEELLA
jgi:hypothetical protein